MLSKKQKLNLTILGVIAILFLICCLGIIFTSNKKTLPRPAKTNVVVSTSITNKPSVINEVVIPSISAIVPRVTESPKTTRTHSGTIRRGQYCSANEHYWYGIIADGSIVQCLNKNGWRWEQAS